MHRYEELEKLYYKNKIKKYAFILLLFIIIAGIVCFVYNLNRKNSDKNKTFKVKHTEHKELNSSKTVIKKTKTEKTKKETNVSTSKKTVKEKKLVYTFELPKIENTKEENKTIQKNLKNQKTVHQKKQQKQQKKLSKQPVKDVFIIQEKSVDIKDLINNFSQNPSFDVAMMISKYYYKKNDLANAKLWALRANNINPQNYQSWIMFAKILLKKNDKIKAKEVLNIYLNDYGQNDNIIKLLRSINER